MLSIKSFTVLISGNQNKINYLKSCITSLQNLSGFVFSLGKVKWSEDFNSLYKICREKFPELNSKVLQSFLRNYYCFQKGKKLPKKIVNASILIDTQSFNLKYNSNTKLSNYWIKFHRKRFPLFGKRILDKFKNDLQFCKLVQIFERNKKLYCKLSIVKEITEPNGSTIPSRTVGLDINTARIVLSNNKFYLTKQLKHRKLERYKNNQKKRNLNNYTKNYVHNLTSQIVKTLFTNGSEVLVLEDLKNLRTNCTEKIKHKGNSKKNYLINSLPYQMFRSFLTYKCSGKGIKVITINPAYTSQLCSCCRLLGTRNKYDFVCQKCGYKLDADLNGSRNIQDRYIRSECATSQSSAPLDLN